MAQLDSKCFFSLLWVLLLWIVSLCLEFGLLQYRSRFNNITPNNQHTLDDCCCCWLLAAFSYRCPYQATQRPFLIPTILRAVLFCGTTARLNLLWAVRTTRPLHPSQHPSRVWQNLGITSVLTPPSAACPPQPWSKPFVMRWPSWPRSRWTFLSFRCRVFQWSSCIETTSTHF